MIKHSSRFAASLSVLAAASLIACGGADPAPDTVPPTVAITDSEAGATATAPVTFTFTFSEDVGSSFTAEDILVTGGTAGTLVKVDATHYTLLVTPAANATGTLNVSVAASKFNDLANNANVTTAAAQQAYDTTPPPQNSALVNFDDAAVTYTLTGFGGAEDATVVNGVPGANGKVARVIKSGTAETWAGTTVSTGANQSIATIPFTASAKTMTLRVFTPAAGIVVRLKVEDAADVTHTVETEAVTTVNGGWETLIFNFASPAPGTAALNLGFTYNKASVFFNFGKSGANGGGGTYYFDDLSFVASPAPPPQNSALVNFDDAAVTYTLTGFGGAEDATVVNGVPGANGKVARVIKSGTAETWAGTTVSTGANQSIATIPFTASAKTMTLRVFTPAAGIVVRLKVEDAADVTHTVETEAVTTVNGGWETLTFNFASPAPGTAALNLGFTYNKASVFFNFGKSGANGGGGTYYFDDLSFVASPAPPPGNSGPNITFDDAAVTYTLTGFGGAEDATVVNGVPGANGKVAQVIKSGTAETWAGTTVSTGANQSIATIPFTASAKTMTLRVFTPAAGIVVRLKVEDAADVTHTVETEAVTTVNGGWETLTFNFASPAPGTAALNLGFTYNKASVFFNFGKSGANGGGGTYYFDDLSFVASPAPPPGNSGPNITFDDAAVTYTLTGFGGAEDATVVNGVPGANGKVAQVIKSGTAETWAGTTVSTGANQSIATIPFSASAKTMTMRVFTPAAGIPVRLKVEDAADVTHTVETEAITTVNGGWETLTFNFANQAPGTAALNLGFTFNKASVFFNFGKSGANGGGGTYYFDTLTFVGP